MVTKMSKETSFRLEAASSAACRRSPTLKLSKLPSVTEGILTCLTPSFLKNGGTRLPSDPTSLVPRMGIHGTSIMPKSLGFGCCSVGSGAVPGTTGSNPLTNPGFTLNCHFSSTHESSVCHGWRQERGWSAKEITVSLGLR